MSLPASDSNEPKHATTAAAQPQQFDLLAFWIQYQRLIIRVVVVALLAVAAWGIYLFMDYRRRAGSEEALTHAKSAADYRKASTDWSGTPAAGTATIRLAEALNTEGKPAEAAQALREFLEKYQSHPLRVTAAHALAASLETAGKNDEALAAYQKFGVDHARSAFAPLAFIGQARVLMALNRTDEAQKALESVEQKFPGNPFAYDAQRLLDEIKNAAGRKTGGSPRPTPPPAPVPAPAPALNLQGGTPPPPPPAAPVPPIGLTPTPVAPAVPATPLAAPVTPPPATPLKPEAPATPPATPPK